MILFPRILTTSIYRGSAAVTGLATAYQGRVQEQKQEKIAIAATLGVSAIAVILALRAMTR